MLLYWFSFYLPLVHCMRKAFLLVWCKPFEEPELASCARHNRRAEHPLICCSILKPSVSSTCVS